MNHHEQLSLDFRFLFEASKRLHGYLVHEWFMNYLGHITASFKGLSQRGYLGRDWRPSAETDYLLAVDLTSLDQEPLTDAVGLYLYIYFYHKHVNARMRGDPSVKRALYLRGFEYQTDIGFGEGQGIAATIMVPDSWYFTSELAKKLRGNFGVLASLAPEDVYFARDAAKRCFDQLDYASLQRLAQGPPSSFYLNANYWRADISQIVDRVDYFVVYLPSLTESSLWEISLLREKRRQRDATIVFDPVAVQRKGSPSGFDRALGARFSGTVRWPGAAVPDRSLTAEQWHERLSSEFHVVSPTEFITGIDQIKDRIAHSSGVASSEARHDPIAFRFEPAVSASELGYLERYHRELMTLTRSMGEDNCITNLPWYMGIVGVSALTGLILGRHDETGRALARYAGAVSALLRYSFSEAAASSRGRVTEDDERLRGALEDSLAVAREVSWTLLSLGKSHEFGDYRQLATDVCDEESNTAAAAVRAFMDRLRL